MKNSSVNYYYIPLLNEESYSLQRVLVYSKERIWASISITFAIAAAAWVHVEPPHEELIEALRDAVSEVLSVGSKTPQRRRFRDLH